MITLQVSWPLASLHCLGSPAQKHDLCMAHGTDLFTCPAPPAWIEQFDMSCKTCETLRLTVETWQADHHMYHMTYYNITLKNNTPFPHDIWEYESQNMAGRPSHVAHDIWESKHNRLIQYMTKHMLPGYKVNTKTDQGGLEPPSLHLPLPAMQLNFCSLAVRKTTPYPLGNWSHVSVLRWVDFGELQWGEPCLKGSCFWYSALDVSWESGVWQRLSSCMPAGLAKANSQKAISCSTRGCAGPMWDIIHVYLILAMYGMCCTMRCMCCIMCSIMYDLCCIMYVLCHVRPVLHHVCVVSCTACVASCICCVMYDLSCIIYMTWVASCMTCIVSCLTCCIMYDMPHVGHVLFMCAMC